MFMIGGTEVPSDARLVMGIINATPDSFYDEGSTFRIDAALDRIEQFVAEGVDIVDIGGVKAGRGPVVDPAEETARVEPMVRAVRAAFPKMLISLDTWRADVARAVIPAGVDIVNDAWGGYDPDLKSVAAEFGVSLVCTHTGGLVPRMHAGRPRYDKLLDDVSTFLLDLARHAERAGVDRSRIIVDPGHDFAKNTHQSLLLTRHLDALVALGYPVLVAPSNKDFIGESLRLPKSERVEGTMAVIAVCAWHGANIFRVHNVRQARHTVDMVATITGHREPDSVVRHLI